MPNTYTTSTSTEYKVTLPNPNWLNDKDAVKVTFTNLKRASACDNCPNNPVNGGTGICHCVLGLSGVYC